jgi:hypothetical protein
MEVGFEEGCAETEVVRSFIEVDESQKTHQRFPQDESRRNTENQDDEHR